MAGNVNAVDHPSRDFDSNGNRLVVRIRRKSCQSVGITVRKSSRGAKKGWPRVVTGVLAVATHFKHLVTPPATRAPQSKHGWIVPRPGMYAVGISGDSVGGGPWCWYECHASHSALRTMASLGNSTGAGGEDALWTSDSLSDFTQMASQKPQSIPRSRNALVVRWANNLRRPPKIDGIAGSFSIARHNSCAALNAAIGHDSNVNISSSLIVTSQLSSNGFSLHKPRTPSGLLR